MHEIIMLHVNMKILKFDINNLYVNINMLHVDIIYRAFRVKSMSPYQRKKQMLFLLICNMFFLLAYIMYNICLIFFLSVDKYTLYLTSSVPRRGNFINAIKVPVCR